jgi:RNase adaptor protein for sRNA GlmZ degradation
MTTTDGIHVVLSHEISDEDLSEISNGEEEKEESDEEVEEQVGRENNNIKCVLLTSFAFECSSRPNRLNARIIDVRHLPNPTKTMISKGMTGLDKKLRDDFFSNKDAESFYNQSFILIKDAIDDSQNNQKLEFSFGCHRGKHRSVSFVERMRVDLERSGILVSTFHHNLIKKGPKFSNDYKKKAFSKRNMVDYQEEE